MAIIRFQDAQSLQAVLKVVTPQRQLCCERVSTGIAIFALLEGVPVGLAHLEEAIDAQVNAVAASESETFGAEKKFAVFGVVQESVDAQADGLVGAGGEMGIGDVEDLLALGGERVLQFGPAHGFF